MNVNFQINEEKIAKVVARELKPQLVVLIGTMEAIIRQLDKMENKQYIDATPEYLSPEKAARRFGISTKTLGILAATGKIRKGDNGTHARYCVASIRAYINRKNKGRTNSS